MKQRRSTRKAAFIWRRHARPASLGPITLDERRIALVHHIELVAAAEGRGVPIQGGSPARDLAVLDRTTRLFLANRKRQLQRQRDGRIAEVARVVANCFREIRANPEASRLDLQTILLERLAAFHHALTDDELDCLVIPRESLDDELSLVQKAGPGPADTARAAVAKAIGLSPRTIATARAKGDGPMRLTAGRWLSPNVLQAFVRDLIQQTRREPSSLPLKALGSLDEASGRELDAALWQETRAILTDPGWIDWLMATEHADGGLRDLKQELVGRVDESVAWAVLAAQLYIVRLELGRDADLDRSFAAMRARRDEWAHALILAELMLGGDANCWPDDLIPDDVQAVLRRLVSKRVAGEMAVYWRECISAAESEGRL